MNEDRGGGRVPGNSSINPPRMAERLLVLVLSEEDRDCVAGDLRESFETVILPRVGLARARFWYWKQVVCFLGYFVTRRIRSHSPLRILGQLGLLIIGSSLAIALFYLARVALVKIGLMELGSILATALAKSMRIDQERVEIWFLTWWGSMPHVVIILCGMLALHHARSRMRLFWAYLVFFSCGSLVSPPLNFLILPFPRSINQYSLTVVICHLAVSLGIATIVDYWCLRLLPERFPAALRARLRAFMVLVFSPFVVCLLIASVLRWTTDLFYVRMLGIRFLSIILPGLLAALTPRHPVSSIEAQ